jgi:hypothetical protein
LRKVMLLAAMLAMVLAAAVPALAQTTVTQVGSGNVACVQTAVQAQVGNVQVSQYGDNVNIQQIAQECNVNVAAAEEVVASATAAPAAVQYQYEAPAEAQYSASPAAELPPTGGSSLIALGAGVLLVAGGLLARRIVR